MSLTSKTVIPSFSEGIIKPLAWGFKCLTISSWCVSFSNIAETDNCQGKTLRSDPIFLYFFILLSLNNSHHPCSSQHSCFCYLGNKGKLIKEILAHQQLGNRQYLYSTYKRAKHSQKRLKHVSTDFSTIRTCFSLSNMTKESLSVKLLLYSWSWSETGTHWVQREQCSSAWDRRRSAEQEPRAYVTVTCVMAYFHYYRIKTLKKTKTNQTKLPEQLNSPQRQ